MDEWKFYLPFIFPFVLLRELQLHVHYQFNFIA